tara:strand:+ start:148 stop:612 length:465 start_codon:yes stop_codon:yes gene_type:complete
MPRTEEQKKLRKLNDNTPKGKMNKTISGWKLAPRRKYHNPLPLICSNREEYEIVYNRWLNSIKCENPKCNKEYSIKNKKCMDHCHKTGQFRNIICNSCNVKLTHKTIIPNITYSKKLDGWRYVIQINNIQHSKFSKNKDWLLNYKEDYEKEHLK